MRKAALAVFALALSVSGPGNGQTASARAPYDFKGVALGITLSEMRATRARDQRVADARVICSPDPEVTSIDYFNVHVTDDERAAGIVKCAYYPPGIAYASASLGMAASDYGSIDYHFDFRSDAPGAEPTLYQISLRTKIYALDPVLSALRDKFGTPSRKSSGSAVTGLGGVVPRSVTSWTNGVSRLDVFAPSVRVDEIHILYRLIDPAERAEAAVKAASRAAPDRM